MQEIVPDKAELTIQDLVSVARQGTQVGLSFKAKERICRSRELMAKWVHENKVIYGITTGFGAMCNVTISEDDTRQIQENILMSHAAGVGKLLCLRKQRRRLIKIYRMTRRRAIFRTLLLGCKTA
ncbi:hypothetical protein CSA56_16665 [candidate division KSB3 bacterium]|uniref:Histidine ammonia-lyase n=1 Tax=candidate division KSB3 bacterium TaxID=2044937 RepID=A0A2G6K8S1_9BACT|nr:MAG: hypothetical protein CSA56_16665 [candidate division KSB3 bacterium]